MIRQADTTIEAWGLHVSMLRHGDVLEVKFAAEDRQRVPELQLVVDSLVSMSPMTKRVESDMPRLLGKLFEAMDFMTTLHDLVITVAPEMSPFSGEVAR